MHFRSISYPCAMRWSDLSHPLAGFLSASSGLIQVRLPWIDPGSTPDGPRMDPRWTLDGPWMDPGWTVDGRQMDPRPPRKQPQMYKINQIEGFEPWDPSHEKERANIYRKLKSRASETVWASSYGQITDLESNFLIFASGVCW